MTSTTISNMASKVLWGEGLLLRPQHVQRHDQYHEHRLYERMLQAQSMAIYVPSGMKGLKLELLAVAA